VTWFDRLVGRSGRPVWDGTAGTPRSSNAASSHHLGWQVPPAPSGGWVGAEATLEVRGVPADDRLRFWALQVSFEDRGRRGGGAHLGLQWHRQHPGRTAVNWGGYGPDGRELTGSRSALASATGNVNTRDLAWEPQRPYRLAVTRSPDPAPDGGPAWRGTVTDLVTGEAIVVRDLWAAGTEVTHPVVWSEVFADCDAPRTVVAWSALTLVGEDGRRREVDEVRASYQAVSEGGCTTSDSAVDGRRFVQATGVTRRTPPGTSLHLDQAERS
jgi:hypothetical protein